MDPYASTTAVLSDTASVPSRTNSALSQSPSTTSSHSNPLSRHSSFNGVADAITVGAGANAVPADPYRAVHRIRLSALRHNYAVVESAANRQRCSVIVVVKADGYGHGACDTAVHLADYCGAEAFAVATLEEAIELRMAFVRSAAAVAGGGGVGAVGGGGRTASVVQQQQPKNGGSKGAAASMSVAASSQHVRKVSDLFVAPSSAEKRQQSTTAQNGTRQNGAQRAAPPPPQRGVAAEVVAGTSPAPSVVPSSVSSPTPAASSVRTSSPPPNHSVTTVATTHPPAPPPPPRTMRPSKIRILVLGPPVGYPRCFDLYHHHSIELMVSGPEVASALMEWVKDEEGRKRTEVERAASEAKAEAMAVGANIGVGRLEVVRRNALDDDDDDEDGKGANDEDEDEEIWKEGEELGADGTGVDGPRKASGDEVDAISRTSSGAANQTTGPPKTTATTTTALQAATLSNVSGMGLAKEVRAILMNQQAVAVAASMKAKQPDENGTGHAPKAPSDATASSTPHLKNGNNITAGATTNGHAPGGGGASKAPPAGGGGGGGGGALFRGIEDTAQTSRLREKAAARVLADAAGDEVVTPSSETTAPSSQAGSKGGNGTANPAPSVTAASTAATPAAPPTPAQPRRKLRWHALVDSGMGRLGFKTDDVGDGALPNGGHNGSGDSRHRMEDNAWGISTEEDGRDANADERRKDTVSILKELYDAEVHDGAPIEFYGMCTHMADANSNSTYTNSQMTRFLTLLAQVRNSGIAVPTVSTDNSSALLTTNLRHFDPTIILSQPNADTRGFVRTGGAIYGQRPAFTQLRAVSTLLASVRHVSTLKEGESVGYDRAYIAPRNVRIATLTIGFADGYPRELGNGRGRVGIRGESFPVAGNVCMDMLMVELGPAEDTEGVGSKVVVGDVAVLWGPYGEDEDDDDDDGEDQDDGLVRLVDVAEQLKTTQSALTCGLDKARVQRQLV